jgi:pimeloyl-ACP methyl ester carboxylesterase
LAAVFGEHTVEQKMPQAADLYYSYHPGQAHRPALVLLHGAGGTHLYWPAEIRRLPGYSVYALDLPGHGKSRGEAGMSIQDYAGSVHTWMQAVGLKCAVITGHSMGSAVALTLALEFPEAVTGLGLLGAGARLRVHPEILENSAREETFLKAVEIINRRAFSSQAPDRLVELAKLRMAETPAHVLHGDFLACDHFDILGRLQEIRQPTLVLWGVEDNLSPERYARYLAEKIPLARLEVLPGAGHMLMLEKPAQVAELLKSFLDKL